MAIILNINKDLSIKKISKDYEFISENGQYSGTERKEILSRYICKGNYEDSSKIKQELDQIDSRADNWLELTENAFNFITNLREAFKSSDIRLKKDILMALGKKITLKDENLSIEPNEWLIPIKEKYPVLEEQFLGLEPAESLLNTRKNEGLVSVCSQWKSILYEVRTRIIGLGSEIFISNLSY